MAKRETKKYTVQTVSKDIIVSDGKYSLRLEINENHIHLLPDGQSSFIFTSANKLTTIKRWRNVIDCMQHAVEVLAKERKI